MEGKYSLVGVDGNAHSVMGYVKRCMREVGMSQKQQSAYIMEAMSDTYNHLLCISMEMIDRCNRWAEGNYDDEWE